MGLQSVKDPLHLVKRLCLLAQSKDRGMQEFFCCLVTAWDNPPKLLQLLAWVVCCQLLSPPWRKWVLSASQEKWFSRSDSRWERMGWLLYSHLYLIYGIGKSKGLREWGDELCGSLRWLLKSKCKEKSWLWGFWTAWSVSAVGMEHAGLFLAQRGHSSMNSTWHGLTSVASPSAFLSHRTKGFTLCLPGPLVLGTKVTVFVGEFKWQDWNVLRARIWRLGVSVSCHKPGFCILPQTRPWQQSITRKMKPVVGSRI